jgi:hypothetical protein
MKKLVLIAALLAVWSAQPGWAATKAKCACAATSKPSEAEMAIRYMTELMVISSACQNTTYAEFRLRNKDAIIAYQHALMVRFHGAAAFDRWNTSLANQLEQTHINITTAQLCQESDALMKQAAALDTKGFKAYAAAQAAAAPAPTCGTTSASSAAAVRPATSAAAASPAASAATAPAVSGQSGAPK